MKLLKGDRVRFTKKFFEDNPSFCKDSRCVFGEVFIVLKDAPSDATHALVRIDYMKNNNYGEFYQYSFEKVKKPIILIEG